MQKTSLLKFVVLLNILLAAGISAYSQDPFETQDTFFLAKKKGILGKLGRQIASDNSPFVSTIQVNPFERFVGKVIRSIEIVPLGFGEHIRDTLDARSNFATRIANQLHKNTKINVIRDNLLFAVGDTIVPLIISDNERFLRELPYLAEAQISIYSNPSIRDSVDVIVLTEDVFSIGGSGRISGSRRAIIELKEENLGGSGSKISATTLYEKDRDPHFGYGAEYVHRNVHGYFVNWTTGFKTFNTSISTGRYDEHLFYVSMEKPLVSRYSKWIGAADISYNVTRNAYFTDSLYNSDFRYRYSSADLWVGYNLGLKKLKRYPAKISRHFASARTLYSRFNRRPEIYDSAYSYQYANINGLLFSYTYFKMRYYRTNFIYGFGRNEDVPSGINLHFTNGWINKQNRKRFYSGIDVEANHFSRKGSITSFKLRTGGFFEKAKLEDIDLLVGLDLIAHTKFMNGNWLRRNFVSAYITKQIRPLLSTPLMLQSNFGLPYFINDSIAADTRATIKLESVFFNLNKFLGFRFAPFFFADACFLKSVGSSFRHINGFSAFGGGIRTRNENLIFGTIELKGYLFPRVTEGMKNWKVELSTNLKFKYINTYIKRPDFVQIN